jgi:hypothetical protein
VANFCSSEPGLTCGSVEVIYGQSSGENGPLGERALPGAGTIEVEEIGKLKAEMQIRASWRRLLRGLAERGRGALKMGLCGSACGA